MMSTPVRIVSAAEWRRRAETAEATLREIRRYALAVVGASEAYGETESVHLWQEVADMADTP